MKKSKRYTAVGGKGTKARDSVVRADVVEAREIHLVTGEGQERKSRMSITLDTKGYPMIRMGDFGGPHQGVTKLIEIGFDVSSSEHWPHVKLSVGRGSWECSTTSVVDRIHDRQQQTYPETSMHHHGNIRTYYKVNPNGVASLELWGTNGKRYTITGDGRTSTHVLEDGRCICDNAAACAGAKKKAKERRQPKRKSMGQ